MQLSAGSSGGSSYKKKTTRNPYIKSSAPADSAYSGTTSHYSSRPADSAYKGTTPGGYSTLRIGSRGAQVKKLQQFLGITADGIFGNQTRQAVLNYQRSHGLAADGIVGNQTWGALLSKAPAKSSSSKKSVPTYRVSSSPKVVSAKPVSTAKKPTTAAAAKPAVAPINFNDYKWTEATLADLAKKYGVDYSMDAAKRMAEAAAADKRNALNTEKTQNDNTHSQVLKQLSDALNSGLANTDQQYFLQGLQQSQDLANRGINAGLATDADMRLAMSKQNAIGDLSTQNQQQVGVENNRYTTAQQQLAQALADLSTQTNQNAQDLYNQRLQQAYAQLNAINSQRQQDALARLQAALQQRGQNIDLKSLEDNMAWNVYNLGQQIGHYNSLGFNNAAEGGEYSGYRKLQEASKSPYYQQFTNNLQSAMRAMNIPASWAQPLAELIGRESSWNPNAKNPKSTAYGYGQFLKATRQAYEKKMGMSYDNPVNQLMMTIQYVMDRYKTPQKALEWWDEHSWY